MLKIFILLFTLLLTTLVADINLQPHETKINKTDKGYLHIDDSKDFQIGSSGVVIHLFDDNHQTIVATITVVDKKDGIAILKYKNFSGPVQNALPSYKIAPKKGDKVILNYLYERALAITPNKKTLNYINEKFDFIDWIHPDIFASKLSINYTPKPEKIDFKNECRDDDFALLFFVIEDRGYFVDCNSFQILHQTEMEKETGKITMVPFYNRLKEIKGRMFGVMGGEGINDYNTYYKNLLGI